MIALVRCFQMLFKMVLTLTFIFNAELSLCSESLAQEVLRLKLNIIKRVTAVGLDRPISS